MTEKQASAAVFYRPGMYRADTSVGHLMRKVLSSILAQADAQLAPLDLTHAQWLPLFKLAMKECGTAADLARDLEIDPGAMTRSMDRLEAKGLVRRERSCTDRRVVQLALTPEGKQLADQVPAVLADVLNGHLADFSQSEWQQLLVFLQRMLANGEARRNARNP